EGLPFSRTPPRLHASAARPASRDVVDRALPTAHPRAARTAIEGTLSFYAMPYDLHTTMVADRRELVDRTLEAIEHMAVAGGDHLEGEMILVAAHLALGHRRPPCSSSVGNSRGATSMHRPRQTGALAGCSWRCSGRSKRGGRRKGHGRLARSRP